MSLTKITALALLAAVAIPAMAGATGIVQTGDRVKVVSNQSTLNGGPFLIDDLTDSSVPDFLSFCIEYTEHISIGGAYYVKIADIAVGGGRSSDDPSTAVVENFFGDDPATPAVENYASYDPLGRQTAYLYRLFVDGALNGYTNDQASRDGLQLALWRLEGEVTNDYRLNPTGNQLGGAAAAAARGKADDFYQIAQGAAGTYQSYHVRVMQLWRNQDYTGARQDQLIAFPVPEPVSTFSALLLGVSALGVARRRFRG